MGMSWSYYVGPYLVLPKITFNYEKWESVLAEVGYYTDKCVLVPNRKIVNRRTHFDNYNDSDEIQYFSPDVLTEECAALSREAAEFLKSESVEARVLWGVVPIYR